MNESPRMTKERWARVKAIFESALQRPVDARRSFVSQACGDDSSLLLDVESLLSGYKRAGNFMDQPAAAILAVSDDLSLNVYTFQIGEIVSGRFKILRFIGRGGMGEVYEAEDQDLCAAIALKIIRPNIADDPSTLIRFKQEIQLTRRITHPNVCRTFDLARHRIPTTDATPAKDVTYLTMELLEGETLTQILRRGRMTTQEALPLIRQMADGLQAAHAAGVVHRDLKPSNLIVCRSESQSSKPRLVITDFGLAQNWLTTGETSNSVTGSGHMIGTLAYMSPEQLEGKAATPATDIYALGLIAYEMVTGLHPFSGDKPIADALRRLKEAPASPRSVVPGIEPNWDTAIQRCLKIDPSHRFSSLEEFIAAIEGERPPQASVRFARSHSRNVVLVAAIVFVLLAILVISKSPTQSGQRSKTSETISVLPLHDLSPEHNEDYFADGMTEELINSLSRISAIRVTSLTSAMHYKGSQEPIPQIARELHVGAVLEGSVRRVGTRIRINVQLIDAQGDRTLWADAYDRELGDVLALQSDVAQAIAHQVRVNLTPLEKTHFASSRRMDPEAYQLYLQGRFFWNKRTRQDLAKAIEYFQKALERDPQNAQIYGSEAQCYVVLGSYYMLPAEGYPLVAAAARKALALDEDNTEARVSLASYLFEYQWDWSGGLSQYERALRANPSYATAHQWYAESLLRVGRNQQAMAEIEQARELDPLSLVINAVQVKLYYHNRQYDQAISQAQRNLGLDPNFFLNALFMGQAYEQKKMYEMAIAQFHKSASMPGGDSSRVTAALGHAYACSGQREKAMEILEQLQKSSYKRRAYIDPYDIAIVYAGLGDRTHIFEWLENAFREHSQGLTYGKQDPRLDYLHSDPRFNDLLRRMHLSL